MNDAAPVELCLHCEGAPRANVFRLCASCAALKGWRNIYKKRKNWTAAWDAHLQQLVERAARQLPLFPRGEVCELPPRPAPAVHVRRNRRVRTKPFQPMHQGEIP